MQYYEHHSQLSHIMPFLFLHYPGESNYLVFIFAWLPMYFLIQSKMGKCHVSAFKLIQYRINLVLWNSSLLDCFDLHSEESPCSVPYHCFHGDPFPIILGIVVSYFSSGAPFPRPHVFSWFTHLFGWYSFSRVFLRKISWKTKNLGLKILEKVFILPYT